MKYLLTIWLDSQLHGHHLEPGTGRRRLLPPGHPDNPLTPTRESGDTGLETEPTNTEYDDLPTGRDLVDLQNQRPLTRREEAQLEARILDREARNGHPISFWRFTRYGVLVAAVTLVIAWAYWALRYVVLA